MMRIIRIDARGRSSSGTAMLEYLTHTEYYVGHNGEQRATARWLGRGAETLGLVGKVSRKQMNALAAGFDPTTGKPLSRSAGHAAVWHPRLDKDGATTHGADGQELGTWRGGHRIGFDCTFSAEKTVSLLFAVADKQEQQRIIAAHRAAVSRAFEVMECTIETRRGTNGRDVIGMQGLVASGHTHFGNRNLEPQLHEHVLVYAVGQGADHRWSAWDAKELYASQRMLGALYRAQLAHELQRLGYGIEKRAELDDEGNPTGEVYYRIAGISDEVRDEFSSRRKEILSYVAEHGGTKNEAALRTRKVKEEPPLDELYETWRQTLAEVPDMPRPEQIRGFPSKTGTVSDADILKQLHASEAVWTKRDLVTRLALENVGRMDAAQVLAESEAFLQRNDLIRINPEHDPEKRLPDAKPARRYTEDRYAARWWVEGIERKLVDGALARQIDTRVTATAGTVDAAIDAFAKERGFAMSLEQQVAVRHLTGPGGVSILSGRAGTGKTTTTEAVVAAYTASGRHVIGCSTSWDAAQKLADETGMAACYATAKLLYDLDRGSTRLDRNSVVIMDEAGMAGTAQIEALAGYVNRAGGKLILEGDANQLQPIDAGSGFRLLADRLGKAELIEIRRQRNPDDRKTVELLYPNEQHPNSTTRDQQHSLGAEVFERLESRGQIDHWGTREQAIAALANDFLASPLPATQKIALAGTRADVSDVNRAIRVGLQARSLVASEGHPYSILDGGHRQDIVLAAGDRVRFGKRDDRLGVVNGSRGQIRGIDAEGVHIRLDDSGNAVTINLHRYQYLTYDYATTVHRSQGQTREQAFQLASAGMTDRHLALVAISRARASYRLYGAENDLDAIAERLGLDRQKVNALEEGIRGDSRSPQPGGSFGLSL